MGDTKSNNYKDREKEQNERLKEYLEQGKVKTDRTGEDYLQVPSTGKPEKDRAK